ncbi:glycosyltransferase [Thalassotalea profundi]|uniref:Colanic acid biosynthesis glycosyltransferase WcaL n=1 Tax=Thalassotalea profundi TaxID=2036687 RepID=A0ABQ3IGM2_9GAMM|nr:glycosyltransferase [Thalassotalea profundi]GHE80585.1 colanic acid biosynthesis glycosyltransferase WcaL [Thalassotalea profundi]
MKVAFFLSKFPVSSETFVLNQINGLISLGVDVNIWALNKGNLNPLDPLVSQYDLLNKTTYLFEERIGDAKSKKFIKRFISASKLLVNVRLISKLFKKRYKNSNKGLMLPAVISRIKGQLVADVVIAHFGPIGVFAQNLQSLGKLDGKIMTVFHGYDISMKSVLEQYKFDYQKLFDESAAVLPISNLWADKLIAMGCPENKVFVNRMGINLTDFSFKQGGTSSTLKLVSVARLIEKKGLFDAITAMSLLKNAQIDFSYKIIGDGPLEEQLKNYILDLGLEDCVDLVGFLPQEKVREVLKETDIFLLPSITAENGDMEGIPVALMESMAMGIITVSTYHSGIPELIENEVSGFLVSEGAPKQLAKTLISISQEIFDLEIIRSNASSVIQNKFNQQLLYQELKSIIEKVHGS